MEEKRKKKSKSIQISFLCIHFNQVVSESEQDITDKGKKCIYSAKGVCGLEVTLNLLTWAWSTEAEGGLWPPPGFIRPGKTTCCWAECICINTQHEHTCTEKCTVCAEPYPHKDSVTCTYPIRVLNMQMDQSKYSQDTGTCTQTGQAHAAWVVHKAQCQQHILRLSLFLPACPPCCIRLTFFLQ